MFLKISFYHYHYLLLNLKNILEIFIIKQVIIPIK
jgi:hypothetical protein